MSNHWNHYAEIRKNQIETGLDITFTEVFKPIYINIVNDLKPKNILEIGGGTGHLALALSKVNSEISVIEPSSGMHNVAIKTLAKSKVILSNASLEEFAPVEGYDLIISHMVVHTVKNLELFYNNVIEHLNPNSTFVFSIPHPCFFNNYKKILDQNYSYMNAKYQEISFSISKDPDNLITNVPYYHRPLSHYINTLSQNSLSLKFLNEIFPSEEIQMLYGALWEEPRYCIFICKN